VVLFVAFGAPALGCGESALPPCSLHGGAPFRLVEDAGGFEIRYRSRGRSAAVAVPREWLVPYSAEDAEGWEMFPSHPYEEAVTAFQVNGALLGLHLSAYAIQAQGSMQLALGRDLFLLLDPAAARLGDDPLRLGTTQSRSRFMGCWQALQTDFQLADVDADGACDIGLEREELRCTEAERTDAFGDVTSNIEGPCAQREPPRWFLFRGAGWVEDPARKDLARPEGAVELPRIGAGFGPVDYVERGAGRPIAECVPRASPAASG
jgi:hypothetical protein